MIGVLLGVESSKQPWSTAVALKARDASSPILAPDGIGWLYARETKGTHSGETTKGLP